MFHPSALKSDTRCVYLAVIRLSSNVVFGPNKSALKILSFCDPFFLAITPPFRLYVPTQVCLSLAGLRFYHFVASFSEATFLNMRIFSRI